MSQRHLATLALFLLFAFPAFQPLSPSALSSEPTLAEITVERFPDADFVLADDTTRTRYAEDGTAVTRSETLIKILTEKGLRNNRTQSYRYNAFYENTVVISAEIIRPDGSVTAIDTAANTKEMTDRSSMSANIYDPNDKRLTLAIPGLKVGDALRVVTENTITRPRMKDTFCSWQVFENFYPILRGAYEVRAPKNKPLRSIALLNEIPGTVTRAETDDPVTGERIHTWTVRDVPQAFPEPSMPPASICVQRLLVSTVATWEEVSKWYSSICEPHLASTPEIDAKVAGLIAPPAGSTTPLTDDEKIRRIFRFVSQEIRYMGIIAEKESPGYEPHDVSLTFNNRYGVCRDKAALLVTMLRVAGFDASPVLINAGRRIDPEVANFYFNHAVTAVRLADGADILMDSTDENTADLFPSYLANKSYLVARPEGDTLRVSPLAPPEENMLRATTRLDVANDSGVAGFVTLDFSGINDNAYRGSFARAKPEDIRRWLEGIVKNNIPGATLTAHEITPANAMDTATPLRVTFAFTAPDFLDETQGKTLVATPWFGANFSIAARTLGDGAGLAKRRFPLEIPYASGLDELLYINLPGRIGETLALPADCVIDIPAVAYSQTITRDGQTLAGKLSLRLRAPQIAPGDAYAELKTALQDIEYADRQSPVLAAAPKNALAPDILTLNDDLVITLADARNWTRARHIRKQVLTYAGKKNNAELRINYNPVWEDVKIENAKVTLKDGSTRTVSPSEINILDAAWVASAPRYPAAKTMVVSLPGVEEGAIIEYDAVTTAKDRPWFTLSQSYFGFDPVENHTFTLNAPTNINLTANADLAAIKETRSAGSSGTGDSPVIRAQTTRNMGESPMPPDPTGHSKLVPSDSDSQSTVNCFRASGSRPASSAEYGLPPRSYLGPVYEATTLNNPAAYARLINDAVEPLSAPTDAIRAKAAELTATARTETERLVAIRDYIARHVRNAGPNFTDLPLSCLTPAEKTLADSYGNTADRAILLAALLRAAGFEPEFLLAASPAAEFWMTDKNVFNPGLFSTLVVRVTADGKPCHLDQLSIYAEPGATALDGSPAIALATGKIETIESAPGYANRTETRAAIVIAENGDAEIAQTDTATGAAHAAFKRRFMEMTPEQRDRAHQGMLSAISQAAEAVGALETDYNYPGALKISARVPRYAVRSGDYLYFDIPGAITMAVNAGADSRVYPLLQTRRTDIVKHWQITLPAGAEIEAAPEPLTWHGPAEYGSVEIAVETARADDGRPALHITQTLRLNPAVIPAANYSTLLELNRRLARPAQWRVLLKTK